MASATFAYDGWKEEQHHHLVIEILSARHHLRSFFFLACRCQLEEGRVRQILVASVHPEFVYYQRDFVRFRAACVLAVVNSFEAGPTGRDDHR